MKMIIGIRRMLSRRKGEHRAKGIRAEGIGRRAKSKEQELRAKGKGQRDYAIIA